MPLAWPRAPAYVHTWRLSDLITALLLLTTAGHAVGDHHHHHHPPRYAGLAAPAAPAAPAALVAPTSPASPIALLNPWLSACDLAQPNTAPDLQGSCSGVMSSRHSSSRPGTRVNGDIVEGPGPPGPPALPGPPSDEACPRSCAVHNASHNQCLHYFRESDMDRLCGSSEARLVELRLRHCCEHSVGHSLTPEALKAVLSSSSQCTHYLSALLELDALAARLSCEFGEILTRYDCDHSYSVNFQCTHCQEAYRRWVCSSLLPHFPRPGGPRVRPCRAACRSVEQKCPFFLPGDRAPAYPTQYAGEPTFLCLDPNIPESGEQLFKSSYGEDDCCYRHCHEHGLPRLCPNQTSCPQGPEGTPPPVVCEPPPPAPTPAPGERTLPSACAASVAILPPRLSSGSANNCSRYLLGLIGVLILHQIVSRVHFSSPARRNVALVSGGAGKTERDSSAASNRPRPSPWPRPRLRSLRRPRFRPRFERPQVITESRPLLIQLLRRRVTLRTNRLGKRTTPKIMLPSLFCFVEHVT